MIKGSKICGVSDLDTLNFIINHPYSPQFIGFICNYKKSSRYVEIEELNELVKLDKKKSNFVAVLVKPDDIFAHKPFAQFLHTRSNFVLLFTDRFGLHEEQQRHPHERQ